MFQLIISPCGSIQSVSDEDLALKFMQAKDVHRNLFTGYTRINNNNRYAYSSNNNNNSNDVKINKSQHINNQQIGSYFDGYKHGLGQKSVSSMSMLKQRTGNKKDAQSSFNCDQQRNKSTLIEGKSYHKEIVERKIKPVDGSDVNCNKLPSLNVNTNTINIRNKGDLKSVSSVKSDQEKVTRKTSNQPTEKESKTTDGLNTRVDKTLTRESNRLNKNDQATTDKIKSVSESPKEISSSIVTNLTNDSSKSVISGKDGDGRRNVKSAGKVSTDKRVNVDKVKKVIDHSGKVKIKEIKRTTAKHEQYKNLRGSHRRVCLKSSNANIKPYVEAAVNRPKFKRCKSSIPSRFKVNIPLEEIERRWRLIKERERQKSAEKQLESGEMRQSDENGNPLEFLLLYEINRGRDEADDDDNYEYYNVDDEENSFPVHSRLPGRDDYSDHGTEYDEEEESDYDDHYNHLLKRTYSEPALFSRDLTV